MTTLAIRFRKNVYLGAMLTFLIVSLAACSQGRVPERNETQLGELDTQAGFSGFKITNENVGEFASWAATSGVEVFPDDYNNDGKTDFALVNKSNGWTTIPIAFSNGDGSFTITNEDVGSFASWAATSGTEVFPGDYNYDGKTDIALVNRSTSNGGTTIPIAFSKGDGSFTITNQDVGVFASWAATSGTEVFPGDYNNDNKTDFALVNRSESNGWTTIPIAFSAGDGSFSITNVNVGVFAGLPAKSGIKVLPGDYNADGKTDIALVNRNGSNGWTTIPIAFSKGDGSFTITDGYVGNLASVWDNYLEGFATWAAMPGTEVFPGDYNYDGRTDLAVWGGNVVGGGYVIPIAFSKGDGNFTIEIKNPEYNPDGLRASGTKVLPGDYNGGGKTDFAFVNRNRSNGWTTIPIAFSKGDGSFTITNEDVGSFASWAATPGTEVFPGDYNGDGKTDIALVNRSTSNGWTTIPIAFSNYNPAPGGGETDPPGTGDDDPDPPVCDKQPYLPQCNLPQYN